MPNLQKLILGTQKVPKKRLRHFFLPIVGVIHKEYQPRQSVYWMNEIPNTVQNDGLTNCHQLGLLAKNT
jgi:hypothetical protein